MAGQEMMIIIKLLFPLIIRNNGLNDALTMINDNTSSRPCTAVHCSHRLIRDRGHQNIRCQYLSKVTLVCGACQLKFHKILIIKSQLLEKVSSRK